MFIQVIEGEIKDLDAVRGSMQRWQADLAPGATGWLGGTYGVTDDGRLVAVVRFDSEQSARANSDRAEQAEWWSEMAAHFVGDVIFRNYSTVYVMGPGGSDDAGFVQLIQGTVKDPQVIGQLVADAEQELTAMRPDVLGATLGVAPDGQFTQTVAFTSEAAAREGEAKELPPEAQAFLEQLGDLTFTDLRNPWFESR